MSQFKTLIALRERYPSTTAAAHNLLMRANELQLVEATQTVIELHDSTTAQVSFDNALWEVLIWAAKESGATSAVDLLKFTNTFLAMFAIACPRWDATVSDITDHLTLASRSEHSILVRVLEQEQSDQVGAAYRAAQEGTRQPEKVHASCM